MENVCRCNPYGRVSLLCTKSVFPQLDQPTLGDSADFPSPYKMALAHLWRRPAMKRLLCALFFFFLHFCFWDRRKTFTVHTESFSTNTCNSMSMDQFLYSPVCQNPCMSCSQCTKIVEVVGLFLTPFIQCQQASNAPKSIHL